MALAVGTFLVFFGAFYSTQSQSITSPNTSECEVSVAMNIYRLSLALALPFFIVDRKGAVGPGW